MFVLLAAAVSLVLFGGQIAVIVTDYLQGTFFNIMLCVITLVLLLMFPWSQLIEGLSDIPSPDNSLIHPFKSSANEDFNFWFYLIQSVAILYTFLAWQGQQGYYSSATSAHEARMGRVIGSLSNVQRWLIFVVPMFMYVVLHHPDWAGSARLVEAELAGIGDETLRSQLTTTLTLRTVLPVGLVGAFAAMMLAAFVSTHNTYLHSWGSILIQDVVLPLQKEHVDQERHVRWLRRSVIGVATFIFLFSLLVPLEGPIMLYFVLTGTIWLGGAGAIIIGGLYWRRGTTAGAYGALVTGGISAIAGFVCEQSWPSWFGEEFPLNSQWVFLFAMMASSSVYVILSLLSGDEAFDLNRLLRRENSEPRPAKKSALFSRIKIRLASARDDLGWGDTLIMLVASGWSVIWAVVFVIGTVYNLVVDVSDGAWARFWQMYTWLSVAISVAIAIWLAIGGGLDLRKMLKLLRQTKRDDYDDGSV
ncbi:MAG: sodium:solute symporter, partial [Gammaproteobacteria bacterium]|nr:sodium:solute symporter [Gammaproteobacteria bacterium]